MLCFDALSNLCNVPIDDDDDFQGFVENFLKTFSFCGCDSQMEDFLGTIQQSHSEDDNKALTISNFSFLHLTTHQPGSWMNIQFTDDSSGVWGRWRIAPVINQHLHRIAVCSVSVWLRYNLSINLEIRLINFFGAFQSDAIPFNFIKVSKQSETRNK